MISFGPTEEQELARSAMQEFAAQAMRPIARDCDEAHGPEDTLSIRAHANLAVALDSLGRTEEAEREFLRAALEKSRFNQRMAADLLGLSYHQFRGKLRKHDIAGKPPLENA